MEAVADFFYPPRCPSCRAYVEERGGWCPACLEETARLRRLPVPPEMGRALESVWAVGRYHGGLQALIRGLKYHGKRGNLPYIVALLDACSSDFERIPRAAAAVPVPLHPEREKERGFNQAELIFRRWLEARGIPMERLLLRSRRTLAQYGLGAEARQQNVRGAFSLAEGADVAGRRLLLLDDIMTTGATLFACAELLNAGGAAVTALVLASDRT